MGFKSLKNPYSTVFKQQVVDSLYHDIYIFAETHCLKDEVIEFDNYFVYCNNRVPRNNIKKGSGGVSIAIHNSVLMCHTILSVVKGVDGQLAIKLKCTTTGTTLGILGLYLSPDSYKYGQDAESFFNEASVLWQDLGECDLLIGGGDLNARTKNLIDFVPEIDGHDIPIRQNPDSAKNAHADSFITFLKDNRSVILNGRVTPQFNNYTFVCNRGNSVPDYFFCPLVNLINCISMKTLLITDIINRFQLLPPRTVPDHSLLSSVFVTSSFNLFQGEQPDIVCYEPSLTPKPGKKNLGKITEQFMMSEEILNLVLNTIRKIENQIESRNEIDSLWDDVKQIFLSEMSLLPDMPTSSDKKQNRRFNKCKSFWNDELEALWLRSCNFERMYLKFKVQSHADLPAKRLLRLQFKDAQHVFDKKYRYYKRKYTKTIYNNLETQAKSNPSDMWSTLEQLNRKPRMKVAMEIVKDDKSISHDIKEVLTRWFTDISQLFSGLNANPELAYDEAFYREVLERKLEFENLLPEEHYNFEQHSYENLNEEISYDEVAAAIDKCKNRKSFLEIPNEALKNKSAKILLHSFFNKCFSSGYSPQEWDFSNIIPIPKKGKDSRDPLQCRCITIMCCVAKIYSGILNKRLQHFLEVNNILVDEQNGFRVGRSCIDHIFVLCTILRNRNALGKSTFLCFIDYKKAFDSVNRNLLMFKLSKIGINGHMYNAITSLYSNPKARVILQENCTDYFNCPIGLKQGDCLSPTLFSIYINDLAIDIKESGIGIKIESTDLAGISELMLINILLYADDIVLLAENEEDLQALLFIVQSWCIKWRLDVNLSKTNILHIRPKRRQQSKYVFLFNNRPVEYCKFYKYLGCYLDEHLDYNFTSEKQSDSAGNALSSIITKMIKLKGLPYTVYSMLYRTCISSISQYGSEVYGFKQYDSEQRLQLRALRAYLGLPKNVTSCGLLSEFDMLLPYFQTRIRMIQHLNRIFCTPSNRLMYMIYKWDHCLNESGRISTWSTEVKTVLEEHNLGTIFQKQEVFNIKTTVEELKRSMLIKQKELLKTECTLKPKLRTFLRFKDFDTMPPHIGKALSFYERRVISKLRLGILPLRIESGRYLRPHVPENDRTCYCGSGKVESEYYALFECKMYNNLRNTWLSRLCKPANFLDLSENEKLKVVLNHPDNVRPTAQYVLALMDYRSLVNDKY